MVTDYSVEKIVRNCVLMNKTKQNYKICRFNKKKYMPLTNLIYKVKSQQFPCEITFGIPRNS